MTKEDFIDLIETTEGIQIIDDTVRVLTGQGLDEGVGGKAFRIWEVLRRNSAERYHISFNLEEDTERYHEFYQILESKELTPEEKYEKLKES